MAKTVFNGQNFRSSTKIFFLIKKYLFSLMKLFRCKNAKNFAIYAFSKKMFWFDVRFQESQELFPGMVEPNDLWSCFHPFYLLNLVWSSAWRLKYSPLTTWLQSSKIVSNRWHAYLSWTMIDQNKYFVEIFSRLPKSVVLPFKPLYRISCNTS